MSRHTLFVCESQPIVLEGLTRVLESQNDFDWTGSASTYAETIDKLNESPPDILLAEQAFGLKSVFAFLGEAHRIAPRTKTVLWATSLAELECFRALQLGARSVVRKTLPVTMLLDCLRTVARGNVWLESALPNSFADVWSRRPVPRLTPREREIVELVCRGRRNKQIAEDLCITPGTVKVHLMHIFEKSGVKDRVELAADGRRLLGLDPAAENSERD